MRQTTTHTVTGAINIRRVIAPTDLAQGMGGHGLPGHLLYCPTCRSSYQHVAGPSMAARGADYAAWEGRGNLVRLPMHCEMGHSWEICFGFHKGESWIFVQATGEWSEHDSGQVAV
jgi:hypothetical protein